MNQLEPSLSVVKPKVHYHLNNGQKAGLGIGVLGLLALFLAFVGVDLSKGVFIGASLILMIVGTVIYSWSMYRYLPEGIKNNGVWFKSISSKGILGWIFGVLITGFYVLLYWFPGYLGLEESSNTGFVALFDPLSMAFKGQKASQWFAYGTLYTVAILALGVKFMLKYRHNRYQLIRTVSVMTAQLFLAYLIPEILEGLNQEKPYFAKDLKNIWPLNYYFFEDWHLNNMLDGGSLGMFYLVWGILLIVLITPLLTYYFGKRWYCSWVCGCGGLAETAGDPFRHLSDKSLEAWQIERIIIHGVLALIVVTTGLVLYTYFTGDSLRFKVNQFIVYGFLAGLGAFLFYRHRQQYPHLKGNKVALIIGITLLVVIGYFAYHTWQKGGSQIQFSTYELRKWYGFFIGASFSGVIGVGFYPLMGNRVWCRFGCPMAAILGIQQKYFSRFRITTNGGQCISCGNCSTYCEMGIDVRSYAQRGQDIVRASCVGCGICSAVCPRGVLRLENSAADVSERTKQLRAIHIEESSISLPQ